MGKFDITEAYAARAHALANDVPEKHVHENKAKERVHESKSKTVSSKRKKK